VVCRDRVRCWARDGHIETRPFGIRRVSRAVVSTAQTVRIMDVYVSSLAATLEIGGVPVGDCEDMLHR
jgi:hypothetical protein